MVKAVPLLVLVATSVTVLLTVIVLLAPLAVVISVSFTQSEYIAFPPQGFTLRWYTEVLGSKAYLESAWTSLRIAVLVTLAATLIGGAAAIALHRGKLPMNRGLSTAFLSPLVLPTIIFAIGLLMAWSQLVGPISELTLWLGHTVICLPYVIRTTLAVLSESDPFLEEAARTMGANRWQCLWHVIVPQCLPGLAAGAFFAFNISFDEAVLSLFLRNPDLTTLPVQIYGQLEFSPDPSVAAVSALMIGVTILLIIVIDRALGLSRFARA